MLDILAHSNLPHDSVLVTINTSQLTQMSIHVLEAIIKLEGINVTQTILHITINHKFNNSENLSTQVEGITETRSLTLLCGESLHWFQVEIVIQMQVV